MEHIFDSQSRDCWIDLETVVAIAPDPVDPKLYEIMLPGGSVLVTAETARHIASLCSR